MLKEVTITKGGYYPEVNVTGTGENLYKDGLVIDAPGEVVRINRLNVNTVRSPVIVKRAERVIIDNSNFHNFWGDAYNVRQSKVLVRNYVGRDIKPRLPYEEFHVDVIVQAYAVKEDGNTLDPDGIIRDVIFENIDVVCDSTEVNAVMLSELCRYEEWGLGTKSLKLKLAIDYWINGNNLSHSVIGGLNVDIASFNDKIPGILLKDRPKQGVCSNHESTGNVFFNIPGADGSDCGKSSHIFDTSSLDKVPGTN